MKDDAEISRYQLLVRTGTLLGVAMLPRTPIQAAQGELRTLTRLEYDTLNAFCARLIPTDEAGFGAREAITALRIDWA